MQYHDKFWGYAVWPKNFARLHRPYVVLQKFVTRLHTPKICHTRNVKTQFWSLFHGQDHLVLGIPFNRQMWGAITLCSFLQLILIRFSHTAHQIEADNLLFNMHTTESCLFAHKVPKNGQKRRGRQKFKTFFYMFCDPYRHSP